MSTLTTTTSGLRGRSLLRELDLAPDEWRHLLDLAASLKADKHHGREQQQLRGRNLALVLEEDPTHTRCAFEVAAHDQGAHVTHIGRTGSQLGRAESVADTARVLGRMFDGIGCGGPGQDTVETMAALAGVPVWNARTDRWHPTQALCDTLTMREHVEEPDDQICFAFVGDATTAVARSLLVAGAMLGMDVRMVSPASLSTPPEVQAAARAVAAMTGARLLLTDDLDAGVGGVDFLHTGAWVSTGEPAEAWAERIDLLAPYQVDAEVVARTGNPEVRFMHGLPASHGRDTEVGEQLFQQTGRTSMEVTDEVFESAASIVLDQVENRVHVLKAVLVATLGGAR